MVRKLEEKERLLQTNLATVEKELVLRQQVRCFLILAMKPISLLLGMSLCCGSIKGGFRWSSLGDCSLLPDIMAMEMLKRKAIEF